MKKLLGIISGALLALGACAHSEFSEFAAKSAPEAALETAAAATAKDRIRSDVIWLADDAREGREAGTPGHLAAADYVAARMAAMGLTPAGDNGSWFQSVPLRKATPVFEAAAFSITLPDGERVAFTHLEDFRVYPEKDAPAFDITAPAVFAGYGVYAPEAGHNDYEGLDLTGKIVVAFSGAPDNLNSEQYAYYQSSALKRHEAAARGAVGMILMRTAKAEARTPWEYYASNPRRASTTWVGPDGRPDISGPGVKGMVIPHPHRAPLLFAGAPRPYEAVRAEVDAEGGAPKGFDLAVTVSMAGALKFDDFESPTVAGLIPGSDPALKHEYLVLTAHLDHTGVNEKLISDGKDGIHNGAMDNAMGVAVMMEVARKLSAQEMPPRRSVVVLAVTAEEKGLLGSEYYAHFPTVPKEAVVANLNLDMPVMLHDFADVIAFGSERSSLDKIVKESAKAAGVALAPDPFPEEGLFTRSDHYSFVEQGIPSVYLMPGLANGGEKKFNDFLENHYHRPSDDPSLPIRFGSAARFAELNYLIARNITDAERGPEWNEGDFFGDLFSGE